MSYSSDVPIRRESADLAASQAGNHRLKAYRPSEAILRFEVAAEMGK